MKKKGLKSDDPVYLCPKYVPSRGGATDVALADKNVKTEYRSVKTVVGNIFLRECVDKRAMRNLAAEITGRKILVPLYVNFRLLLVPFKMRKPVVRGDVCYGYVNYFAVEGIGEDNTSCRIRFFNGLSVSVLGSAAMVRKTYGDASLVAEAGCFKSGFEYDGNNSIKYFNGEDQNPATKLEIEELKREFWMMRESI